MSLSKVELKRQLQALGIKIKGNYVRKSELGRIVSANTKFAEVVWRFEDVQELRPDWTKEQCEEWLGDNEKHIQEAMLSAGWDAISDLLTATEE